MGDRDRERNIDLSFHLLMHSLVDSGMCPDQGSNLQPWCWDDAPTTLARYRQGWYLLFSRAKPTMLRTESGKSHPTTWLF